MGTPPGSWAPPPGQGAGGGFGLPAAFLKLLSDLGWCVRYFDPELWAVRYGLALGVTRLYGAAVSKGWVLERISKEDGVLVHRTIQDAFLKYHGPASERAHEVMVERRVHLTPSLHMTLGQAASYSFANPVYGWMFQAFKTEGGEQTGDLSSDMVDITLMQLWEIKALNEIDAGILQLARYTASYNCVANIPLTHYSGRFQPLTPGHGVDLRVLTPFFRNFSGSRVLLVIPFEFWGSPLLPGLIAYIAVKVPRPEEMAMFAAAAEAVRRLLKELRDRKWRTGRFDLPPTGGVPVGTVQPEQVPAWLGYAALAIGVALLTVVAVAAAPEIAAAAGTAATAARAAQVVARLVSLAGLLPASVALADAPGAPRAGEGAETEPPPPPLTLRTAFGELSANTPQEAVAALQLMAALFVTLDQATGPQ